MPPRPQRARTAGARTAGRFLRGAIALLSGAIAIASYRYLIGKGPVATTIAANRHFDPWLVIHAAGAATALLVAPLQFLPALRRRQPAVHRAIGWLYAGGCLVGSVSGLVLATGVWAGPIAGAGFGALGTAWLFSTGTAVRRIIAGDVASHRRWMIRSFALALSAVTLRLYLPLSSLLGLDMVVAYRTIAWACWVPNAILAEIYLAGCLRTEEPALERE